MCLHKGLYIGKNCTRTTQTNSVARILIRHGRGSPIEPSRGKTNNVVSEQVGHNQAVQSQKLEAEEV